MKFGFLNINKPKNFSSFDVIKKLRGILKIRKLGHAGTLDPMAEGVLVVGVGEATKFIDYIQAQEKEYIAELELGSKSNTYDAEGEIERVDSRGVEMSEIEKIIGKFVGEIDQIPPIFSALKIKGKRAYELARKGEKIKMKSRKIFVKNIKIIEFKFPVLKIKVSCGKGTYIRSLCNDIGEELGVGAYMKTLIRTKVGDFDIKESIGFKEIESEGYEKYVFPLEKAFKGFSKIELNANEYDDLSHGKFIESDKIQNSIDIFVGFTDNRFVGIIERVKNTSKNLIKFKKKVNYG